MTKNRQIENVDNSLISSLHNVLTQKNQLGVLANIIISKYLEKISQLSSYYFSNAGNIIIEGDFGQKIIKEFSALVMIYYNALNIDLSTFAEKIVNGKNETQEDGFIYKILSQIPEPKLFNILLRLSNSSSHINNNTISSKLKSTIRTYPKSIKSKSIQRKSKALFEFIDLTDGLKASLSIESDKILDQWMDRKDLYIYAAILLHLIERGQSSDRIKEEAIKVLESHTDSSFNTYLHLAVAYSERFLTNSDALTSQEDRIVIGYLQNYYQNFEDIETATMNARVFKILDTYFPSKFSAKLRLWQAKVVEIEHKQVIPQLMKKGNYFTLFRKYVDSMSYWGLKIDVEAKSYRDGIYLEEKKKKKEVDKWLSSKNRIPKPINNNTISAEFIIIASYVFSFSLIENPNYESLRNDFNEISKSNITDLIDLILSLERIPNYYKDILEEFYSRFVEYQAIIEGENISV